MTPCFACCALAVLSQRAIMDALFYDADALRSHCGPGGRVIVIAFMRAPAIFLSRLLEVNTDKRLDDIVIVALPFPDNISRAGGQDEVAKYLAETGQRVDRDFLNQQRHRETYAFYARLLQPVYRSVCDACGEPHRDFTPLEAQRIHSELSHCKASVCGTCWWQHVNKKRGMCVDVYGPMFDELSRKTKQTSCGQSVHEMGL